MRRRCGDSSLTRAPSIKMTPASGRINPAIMPRVVDLPHPDGPRRERNSPRPSVSDKSCTASRSAKRLLMSLSSSLCAIMGLSFDGSETQTAHQMPLDKIAEQDDRKSRNGAHRRLYAIEL